MLTVFCKVHQVMVKHRCFCFIFTTLIEEKTPQGTIQYYSYLFTVSSTYTYDIHEDSFSKYKHL